MKQSGVTPIIERVCRKLGIMIDVEPKYRWVGQLTLANGERRYFRNANLDLNTLGATEIAKDKAYAAYFLSRMGYPVPKGDAFFSRRWCAVIGSKKGPSAAWRYAKKLGLPVIVKPNSLSQGAAVFKVHTKREFFSAVSAISAKDRVFLVQRAISGNDYRIVVLDGRVISAYQRLPLSVTGDGRRTIAGLLREKQAIFERIGRDTVIRFDDPRIDRTLARAGLVRRSVLPRGVGVDLLPNANLSTGGDAVDVTRQIHSAWRHLSARIARDMNLRYIGVDVIVRGTLASPPKEYTVLEVNAAAGLDNYAAMGRRQQTIVEQLYEKAVRAMTRRR